MYMLSPVQFQFLVQLVQLGFCFSPVQFVSVFGSVGSTWILFQSSSVCFSFWFSWFNLDFVSVQFSLFQF